MPLTPTQVLDELRHLAAIEHALVVDNLQIHYALGADEGGPAFSAAQMEMRHFRAVNDVLTGARRRPVLERAFFVVPASGPVLPVGLVTPATFEGFAARQAAVAAAVDKRYADLGAAVATVTPPLDPDLASALDFLVVTTGGHANNVVNKAGPLMATRVEPENDLHEALFAWSDHYYQGLLALLRARFANPEVGGELFAASQQAMADLNEANKVLVERGLIPRFG